MYLLDYIFYISKGVDRMKLETIIKKSTQCAASI